MENQQKDPLPEADKAQDTIEITDEDLESISGGLSSTGGDSQVKVKW